MYTSVIMAQTCFLSTIIILSFNGTGSAILLFYSVSDGSLVLRNVT